MDCIETILSFTGKRWLLADASAGLTQPHSLAEWLAGRRLLSLNESPVTFDPSIFPDATRAADRVKRAMEHGEKVAIFGDYDCDGIVSTAMLVRAFRRHGSDVLAILPQRGRDGYGLKPWVIDQCIQAGVTLLLVVDNGILSAEAVEQGNAASIDSIIMDHHHCPAELPSAHVILHPQLCAFPSPHPSAAGVVFLFLHALEGTTWEGRDDDVALAALGTIADLVPLNGFNRKLAQAGIDAMRRSSSGPVHAMIRACGCDATVSSTDVAFRIAPRINAAGRMSDPLIALRVLVDGGSELPQLELLNMERQKKTLECLDALQALPASSSVPTFLFHADSGFPSGIIGLLAGKLTEHWGRPSLVANIQGDVCTASLRSIPTYHITEALERHAHLLTTFGGHAQAAGCTFPLSNIDTLRTALEADAASKLSSEDLLPTISLETELQLSAITLPMIQRLRTLEPFGQGNPDPLFLVRNVMLEQPRTVGNDGKHLQARIMGRKVIGFGLGHFAAHTHTPADLAFSVGIDGWNGIQTPQLMVKDVRSHRS